MSPASSKDSHCQDAPIVTYDSWRSLIEKLGPELLPDGYREFLVVGGDCGRAYRPRRSILDFPHGVTVPSFA